MSSRLWLAVAFVLASGATPARADTSTIAVVLDQAKIARLQVAVTKSAERTAVRKTHGSTETMAGIR